MICVRIGFNGSGYREIHLSNQNGIRGPFCRPYQDRQCRGFGRNDRLTVE